MKFIRFISIRELEALLEDGKIKPIKGNRECLYFFPAQGEESSVHGTVYHSVSYRFEYVSGVVAEISSDDYRRCIVLNLEMDEDKLEPAVLPYADPEGSFWETIGVLEYHKKDGYKISDVVSVDIYKQPSFSFGLVEEKHFDDLKECYEWISSMGLHD